MKFLTFQRQKEEMPNEDNVITLSKFYKPGGEAFYRHATDLSEKNLQQKIKIYEVRIDDRAIKHIKREGIFTVKELRKSGAGIEAVLLDAEGKEISLNIEYFYFRQHRNK